MTVWSEEGRLLIAYSLRHIANLTPQNLTPNTQDINKNKTNMNFIILKYIHRGMIIRLENSPLPSSNFQLKI